jgi:hypothetical protein
MIKPEQIPCQVKDAVKKLMSEIGFPVRDCEALEIVATALNAWPGFVHIQRDWDGSSRLILFLPKDAADE